MTPYIVLISGANRGLGEGLLRLYLAKPNHVVIAANRDPFHPTSKALSNLPTGLGSRLIVVKVDASSGNDALEAVESLAKEGVEHLDLVVANAGVSYVWPKVSDLKIEDLEGHLVPNVYGAIRLYQATLPLLLKAQEPKWVTMGSIAGNIESTNKNRNQPPIPNAAYGPSKSTIHWLTKRINAEEPTLTALVMSPGWVQTELGNRGAQYFGMEQAPVTVEESCSRMVELFKKANKEEYGGKHWSYEEEVLGW
ncbi:hypothetical protein BGZ60DRAFT_496293 [Tricladium varicosporioides]|nr:hypothetical protein BGZ60DRAFT_496293 [Hymenoscyphus varicosporioides]